MSIMYAVISYDINTDHELYIAGWSADESKARELESRMNNASATPLLKYRTEPIQLYGATAEYQAYGDFDALIRNGIFHAITPAGQGEEYRYLHEGSDVIRSTNLLKGLASYLA